MLCHIKNISSTLFDIITLRSRGGHIHFVHGVSDLIGWKRGVPRTEIKMGKVHYRLRFLHALLIFPIPRTNHYGRCGHLPSRSIFHVSISCFCKQIKTGDIFTFWTNAFKIALNFLFGRFLNTFKKNPVSKFLQSADVTVFANDTLTIL